MDIILAIFLQYWMYTQIEYLSIIQVHMCIQKFEDDCPEIVVNKLIAELNGNAITMDKPFVHDRTRNAYSLLSRIDSRCCIRKTYARNFVLIDMKTDKCTGMVPFEVITGSL